MVSSRGAPSIVSLRLFRMIAQAQGWEPGGIGHDRWIDGDSFLEFEHERGSPARLDGPLSIRVNPEIRGKERDNGTTDLDLSRPWQPRHAPTALTVLAGSRSCDYARCPAPPESAAHHWEVRGGLWP